MKHTIKEEKEKTKKSLRAEAANVESAAIYVACVSGLIGFAIGLLLFWNHDITIFARGISIGFVASIAGGFVALITYLLTVKKTAADTADKSRIHKLKETIGTWSLAVVHGLLVFLTYALLFYVVSESFIGALIDPWGASVLIAFATGLSGYIVYLSAVHMSSMRVAMILALFLVSGTFVSMLTATDPDWWYLHFSSLGASGGVSGYTFNGTLIIAGAAVMALTKYITDDFRHLQYEHQIASRTKARALVAGLSGIGIALALVGMFVYDAFPIIHTAAAGGMAVFFIGIVLALPWLTPDFPKAFFIASYGLLTALLISVWLYMVVGYFNLTVFELTSAAIIFTWLVVFVRHTAALLEDIKTERTSNIPNIALAGNQLAKSSTNSKNAV